MAKQLERLIACVQQWIEVFLLGSSISWSCSSGEGRDVQSFQFSSLPRPSRKLRRFESVLDPTDAFYALFAATRSPQLFNGYARNAMKMTHIKVLRG